MARRVSVWVVTLLCLGATGLSAADYVGVKKCKNCHPRQYESWQQTSMAKAFDSLRPQARSEAKTAAGLDPNKDYTTDTGCLGCHTTNGTADMPGVQCEACHGAGSDYMDVMMKNRDYQRAELVRKGLVIPGEAICVRCHNEKNPFHKEFVFQEGMKRGIHQHFPLKRRH